MTKPDRKLLKSVPDSVAAVRGWRLWNLCFDQTDAGQCWLLGSVAAWGRVILHEKGLDRSIRAEPGPCYIIES